ncbi:hypothetical protein [Leifsonia sp. Leaf264]|uniref:hypothetical protein n=1 Tax=Leifsonia sp. Leaf264 TaxID=1736314 RepID=UPI0006FA6F0C|nr:hypothetical protein [Leifsonia sp. Leaf264]KQO98573.1 hypothetical protein ASF30_10960 [Leifsonia sp. Leaf264]
MADQTDTAAAELAHLRGIVAELTEYWLHGPVGKNDYYVNGFPDRLSQLGEFFSEDAEKVNRDILTRAGAGVPVSTHPDAETIVTSAQRYLRQCGFLRAEPNKYVLTAILSGEESPFDQAVSAELTAEFDRRVGVIVDVITENGGRGPAGGIMRETATRLGLADNETGTLFDEAIANNLIGAEELSGCIIAYTLVDDAR